MKTELIPGTDGFYASTCGRIFDSDMVERTYYRNGDGYITASVRSNGTWTTFGVQRLVAMTFVSGRTDQRDFVNHIDGNVENNHAENLEWVTCRENNIHAEILQGSKKKPILRAISPLGEYSFIYSKEEACERIGCTFPELWSAIRDKRLIDGWNVVYNEGPLPVQLKVKPNPSLYLKTPVKLLDLDSREVLRFPSMQSAAEYLGTSTSLITQTLTTPLKTKLCFRKYIAVKIDDDFPELSDDEAVQLKQRFSRPVIVANVQSKEVTIHQTAAGFYRNLGLSKKAVSTALRVDRLREVGGYVFLYLNDENVKRINSYLGLSGDLGS